MYDLSDIKQVLEDGGYSLALTNGSELYTSRDTGIKPLIGFIESGKDFHGFYAADKVVGKAAALLYAYMGVLGLHANVIAADAVEVCRKYRIAISFDTVAAHIINRKGDDLCPMEKLVAKIDEPSKAKIAIERLIAAM